MGSLTHLWNKYFAAIVWIFIGLVVMLIMFADQTRKSTPNYNPSFIVGGIIVAIGVIHGLTLRFPSSGLHFVDAAPIGNYIVRKTSTMIIPRRNAVALSG